MKHLLTGTYISSLVETVEPLSHPVVTAALCGPNTSYFKAVQDSRLLFVAFSLTLIISLLFDIAFRNLLACSCPFIMIFIMQGRIHFANKSSGLRCMQGGEESSFGEKYIICFSLVEEENTFSGKFTEVSVYVPCRILVCIGRYPEVGSGE